MKQDMGTMTAAARVDAPTGDHKPQSWADTRHWLHMVESNAVRAKISAAYAAQFTKYLVARPDFETRAEDELAKAEEDLRVALSCIKTARRQYQQLAVAAE